MTKQCQLIYKSILLRSKLLKICSSRFSTIGPQRVSKYETEYEKSIKSREEFWGAKANLIEWIEKPKKILDTSDSPFEKWFVLNDSLIISFSALNV